MEIYIDIFLYEEIILSANTLHNICNVTLERDKKDKFVYLNIVTWTGKYYTIPAILFAAEKRFVISSINGIIYAVK